MIINDDQSLPMVPNDYQSLPIITNGSKPLQKISSIYNNYPSFFTDRMKQSSSFVPSMPADTWSLCRGRDKPDYLLDGNTENICRHWAGLATGKHNQDVSFSLEGQKGTGKSSSGVTLSYNTAKWIAEFLGDDWRDHFDMERTVAIIDSEKADDVMMNTKKYDVRLFDDISLAWGNRNWQSEENKDKNDIFIINRIDNTVNILTTPNTKLIDVVPRSNVNFKGEMDTPYFNFGFTTMKIFKPIPDYRATGYKVLTPFMRVGRDRIVTYIIEKPPKRIWDEYNKERIRATNAVKKDRKEKMMVRKGEEVPEESPYSKKSKQDKKEKYVNPQQRSMIAAMQTYEPAIMDVINAGGNRKDVIEKLMESGLEKSKAKRWTGSSYFTNTFPGCK
jgi:hypothetical protein